MPDTNHYTGIPVPYATEANVVPQVLAAQREVMGPGLRLYATSEANRDARYGNNSPAGTTGVPVGTIVSCPTADYRRMPDNAWALIWRAPIISDDAITPTGDWLLANNSVRVTGRGSAYLRLTLTYQGDDINVPPDGNCQNVPVGQVKDAKTFPLINAGLHGESSGPLTMGIVNTNGVVTLTAVAPGTSFTSGKVFNLVGDYETWL